MFVVAFMLLMRAYILSCVRLFVMPWTVVHQAPLSMEFSRQEHWSGLPSPPPGDLPDPRIGCSLKIWALFFLCGIGFQRCKWSVLLNKVWPGVSVSLPVRDFFVCFVFFPVLLSYNQHIVLYKFKVYRLTIWLTYIMKWLSL